MRVRGEGGGQILPIGQEIACHFLRDYTMVTKILDFIHKYPNSFFHYLDRFFRNLAETDEKLQFFCSENREINFFFNFFSAKVSDFVSNLNDDCSQLFLGGV